MANNTHNTNLRYWFEVNGKCRYPVRVRFLAVNTNNANTAIVLVIFLMSERETGSRREVTTTETSFRSITTLKAVIAPGLQPLGNGASLMNTAINYNYMLAESPSTLCAEVTDCLRVACNSGTQEPVLWTALIMHFLTFWLGKGYTTDKETVQLSCFH